MALAEWKRRARQLKVETYALYLASKDPEVPWFAKALTACVVAYALSPIDLIPDFIPVLGYLDDIILIPLGITIALRLIPVPVMQRCREQARMDLDGGKLKSLWGAAAVIAVWLILLALVVMFVLKKTQTN